MNVFTPKKVEEYYQNSIMLQQNWDDQLDSKIMHKLVLAFAYSCAKSDEKIPKPMPQKPIFLHSFLFIHLDCSGLNMQISFDAFCNFMRVKFDF